MLSVENDNLEREVERVSNMLHHTGKQKDWEKDVHELRLKIAQLENKLVLQEQQQTLHEKVTTVTYVEDPKHQKLRMDKERLDAEVGSLAQKIKFHENRMALGTNNYETVLTSMVTSSGEVRGEKRSIRKSAKSKQMEKNVSSSVVSGQVVGGQVVNYGNSTLNTSQGNLVMQDMINSSRVVAGGQLVGGQVMGGQVVSGGQVMGGQMVQSGRVVQGGNVVSTGGNVVMGGQVMGGQVMGGQLMGQSQATNMTYSNSVLR